MTKDQFIEQFKSFMMANPPLEILSDLAIKAINSNIIDLDKESENSYRSSKVIYHAVLCFLVAQWKPFLPKNKRESKAIQKFLLNDYNSEVETAIGSDKTIK
jgi:hypothetical protein